MKRKFIRFLRKIASMINIELSSKLMYWAFVHKKLNLEDPKTFNEKLCWLKLREFPYNEKIIKCTDKVQVHEFITQKGHTELLVPLLHVWDKVEDIDWGQLPKQFVLKCNHGCAYNIICKDKSRFDWKSAIRRLNAWMAEDFGLVSGEPHYSKIPRKILCEKYLAGGIEDYKFYCFNGVPRFYYVADTPDGDFHDLTCDFFMPDGTLADFYRLDHKRFPVPPGPPSNLEQMKKIANELSSDFPFVRVDLMSVGGRLYFSELTFTPSAGIMPLAPDGADEKIGEWLDLSAYKR